MPISKTVNRTSAGFTDIEPGTGSGFKVGRKHDGDAWSITSLARMLEIRKP